MSKLDNTIILYCDNHPNIAEILDYIRGYYINNNDYIIEYGFSADMGVIGEMTHVTLHLYTDELKEDGNLAYLIAEHTVQA